MFLHEWRKYISVSKLVSDSWGKIPFSNTWDCYFRHWLKMIFFSIQIVWYGSNLYWCFLYKFLFDFLGWSKMGREGIRTHEMYYSSYLYFFTKFTIQKIFHKYLIIVLYGFVCYNISSSCILRVMKPILYKYFQMWNPFDIYKRFIIDYKIVNNHL